MLPQAQLAAFKRRALATKNEILAALVGTITKENDRISGITVDDIVYLPTLESSPENVSWNLLDLAKLQIHCQPKVVIGSLHSHPNYEGIAISREDIECSRAYGETIFGVYTYWKDRGAKRRTASLDWYFGPNCVHL